MEGMADATQRALIAVGVARAHLVGHSMGTIVCQMLAASRPELVASLTLFGALAEPAAATREAVLNRARLARAGGMADIADQIISHALSAHTRETAPAAVAFVRESVMRQDPESYAQNCEALSSAKAVDARRISAPALLVTGEDDAVNPPSVAQALCDQIKGAVFSPLDRCGHWATVESPRESARRLLEFLARSRPARTVLRDGSQSRAHHREVDMADDDWNGGGSGGAHFINVRILDATGDYPYTGEVLVQGNRVKQITKGSSRFGASSSSRTVERRSSTAWARL